ncbi:hypothetical protein Tco_1386682 [Tanacetum coccineum]
MVNLFPSPFLLPTLRQPHTSSCDCSMNIRNAREELHYFMDVVHRQCPKGNISVKKVASKDNIADILSLPLKHESLNYLRQVRMTKVIKGEFEKIKDVKHEADDDMGYDPSDVAFTGWLESKFFNYKIMDHYTMKALWIYWIRGDDEVELTDEESSDDKDEVAEDNEWYEALEDSELKDEALRNKAIIEGLIKEDDDESRYEQMRRWNINANYDDAYEINHENNEKEELCEVHELPMCNIRRYMMIKYLFNNDEEHVAVKKDEYDDPTIIREEACRAYQEIFWKMDEGWMVTRAE